MFNPFSSAPVHDPIGKIKPVDEIKKTTCYMCACRCGIRAHLRDGELVYIDGNPELEKLYGEQVPVIHIDGNHHDFFRVDPERFKSSLEKHRQRQ